MAKFLNKKEQVIDFKLTPYGKYLLSIGTFKPIYYALFDDNILYDGGYAGLNENQNTAHERIKDGTPYLESLVLFENVELPGNYAESGDPFFQVAATRNLGTTETARQQRLAAAEASYTSLADQLANPASTRTDLWRIRKTQQLQLYGAMFQKGSFATVLDLPRKDSLKFTSMIGDAYLDGETQAAPSWKIITLQGEIEESTQKDMDNDLAIPQLNIELNYAKKVVPYNVEVNPTNFRQINEQVGAFLDSEMIEFVTDNALIYANEVNTELLTENFEIDVFEIVEEFPGAVASSSIMYHYCGDASKTITAGTTLSINDGSPSITEGGYNPITFVFDGTGPYGVDISTANDVMLNLQAAINNSPAEVSTSLGSADDAGCYSSLIVSKTQVGRVGGASARAFGGKSTVITTNEDADVLALANAQLSEPVAATAVFDIGNTSFDREITLIDAAGTSKTYTAKNSEDQPHRYFRRARSQWPSITQMQRQADSLKACIESSYGHNGTIAVHLDYGAPTKGPRFTLIQVTPGPDGNTTITSDLNARYQIPVPDKFTGGSNTTQRTRLHGGMDKRVTFNRKYFEKEEPQVVNGFLQSETPTVNSPQSYTTSSVEYYFDILVDSEIEQRIACKSAEVFNRQSYYVDLDFDCDEIEQDFIYADIYGRVTDPEICQT